MLMCGIQWGLRNLTYLDNYLSCCLDMSCGMNPYRTYPKLWLGGFGKPLSPPHLYLALAVNHIPLSDEHGSHAQVSRCWIHKVVKVLAPLQSAWLSNKFIINPTRIFLFSCEQSSVPSQAH